MNALEKKLASLLPEEILAVVEKIETMEGAEEDWAVADYINRWPFTKFERIMLVRAYQRYEARRTRFKAMELLFPAVAPQVTERYTYADRVNTLSGSSIGIGTSSTTLGLAIPKAEGSRIIMSRSKVGHI